MFQNNQDNRTSLSEMGEFGLIEHLTKNFKMTQSSTLKGIGDDAAIVDFGNNKAVITTDFLVEGVHFDLAYMPLKHLGYKAVMVNLSDICAMNATHTQVTVSIAVSNRFTLEAIEDLYTGIKLACERYQVDLIGGDTSSSQTGLMISVTAIGEANKSDIAYRSGAKDKQLIVLTGDIGSAYMGLPVLEREKQVFLVNPNNQPDLDMYSYIIERQLKPEARTDIKKLLQDLDVKPQSMIDVSDGLSSELIHICTQSGVGCQIYEDKLPLDPEFINVCEEFNLDSTTISINGGEDYELLFTIKMEDFDKIKGNPNLTVIGHTTDKSAGMNLVTRENSQIPIKARGWNHLENEDDAE